MQWLLQDFDDTRKLSRALDRLEITYSWHQVIPFIGELIPEPEIKNPQDVVLFGSYSLWRTAAANGYWPGVFKLAPFVHETDWQPYLLNGQESLFCALSDVPVLLEDDSRPFFVRPVEDTKEFSGRVQTASQIIDIAKKALALREGEAPDGSLSHDTLIMLANPVRIQREWRIWVVDQKIVTYSLYKEGERVVYRSEIDRDALEFAEKMVEICPNYSPAYVIDICRTADGLRLLETNCINAAGFYAADLIKLASAIDGLQRPGTAK